MDRRSAANPPGRHTDDDRDTQGGTQGCRWEPRRHHGDIVRRHRASAYQVELQQLNRHLESLVRDEVAKREAAQQRAAHAERIQALGHLAGGIAHDLNNVLQAITSGSSLATRDAENPERVRRLARLMTEAAHVVRRSPGRLLAFSRRADLRAEPIEPSRC